MKPINIVFFLVGFVLLASDSFAQGVWTWMNGTNTTGGVAVYGTQGVPDPANTPGARYEPCSWTDFNGNFWLFGGLSGGVATNELWKYDPVIHQWAFMGSMPGGNYGTLGIPSPTNWPPERGWGVSSCRDKYGNLWLYSGLVAGQSLEDVWSYNVQTSEWTWIQGYNTGSTPVTYGTPHFYSASNTPGNVSENNGCWTRGDSIYYFGSPDGYADTWIYNTAFNQWTCVKGPYPVNDPGHYGTLGVASSYNHPGSRTTYSSWSDYSGRPWFFGGWGQDTSGNSICYNDVWMFDPPTNNWTWMGGDSTPSGSGSWVSKCQSSTNRHPSARRESRASSKDSNGNFWVFGGQGCDSVLAYNDLWSFCPDTRIWTWVSGDSVIIPIGIYGNLGQPSPTNIPPGLFGSVGWFSNTGDFYVFGGSTCYWPNIVNAMWRFQPDTACVAVCEVAPIQAVIIGYLTHCVGDSLYLTAGGDPPYWWSNAAQPNDTIAIGIHLVQHPAVAGVYILHGTNTTDTAHVTVNALPSFSLGNDTSVCPGQPATLTVPPGFESYKWSNGATFSSITVTQAGTYAVTAVLPGCVVHDSVTVVVNNYPVVNLGSDTTVCSQSTFMLNAGSTAYQYHWSNAATTASIAVTQSGLYAVTVSNVGCAATDSITVTLLDCELVFPDAFTPNHDGLNDLFRPIYTLTPADYRLSIYNRWGQLVYATDNPKAGWDGTFNGKPCGIGSFAWVCTYRYQGGVQQRSGNVTLLR